ncbi:hypothetical protein O3G_MSEX012360 [Manduca sexta]|uniref:Tyr recombinase domain-containing protein n=1 Tax=Manduca sexta TaxID=7130 RepID=A0A921ZPH0_MANSE|nr:hypothetical protein O3G_MSEX012360 [Manduca sexta]
MLGRGDPSCERMSGLSLLGRLSLSQPRPFQVMSSGCGSREALGKPGLENQLRKIYFGTNPRFGIPWHSMANSKKYNVDAHKENAESQRHIDSILAEKPYQSAAITKLIGSPKFCQFCRTPGQITQSQHSSFSAIFQQNTALSKKNHSSKSIKRDKMVARSYQSLIADTQKACNPLPGDRRIGFGMGCPGGWDLNIGRLVESTKKVAQQQKRIICRNSGNQNKDSCFTELTCANTIGQSNFNCIYSKRGRDKIVRTTIPNLQSITANRQIQHNTFSILSSGKIQSNSGQTITRETASRMAPATRNNCSSFSEMGPTRNRSVRESRHCCSQKLRLNRLQRSISKLYRRLQQNMDIQAGMGVSSSQPPTPDTLALKQCDGNLSGSGSRMASSFLASRSEIQSNRTTTRAAEPLEDLNRYNDSTTSSASRNINPESLENWGWGAQIKNWSTQEKDLLKNSWRQSTLSTYLPALRRWLTWCTNSQVDPKSPQPADIARFLIHLFLKERLSYNTILVHKSAVLTFCGPNIEQQTFSNFIIKHTLKAIGIANPKVVKLPFTWDPTIVLNWLSSNPPKDTLFELARRTATVLLLASGRRVHDLTLLKISKDNFIDNGESIYLLPAFGSKTDTHSYRQSAWKLTKHCDESICPVTLVRSLIEKSKSRRAEASNVDNLFITISNKTKAASRTVIGNWIRTVLKDSGIHATPGSCRSAVSSLGWLSNVPLDDILSRSNWKSSTTFFNHYCRQIEISNNDSNLFFKTFTPM